MFNEVLSDYKDLLSIYDEFASKELKPNVLKLDDPKENDKAFSKLEEMGTTSEEMNALPMWVRLKVVSTLARGDGAIAVRVGTALALSEYGLEGYTFVHEGTLARGEKSKAYSEGKVGRFSGKAVQVLGLRGIRWMKGDFVEEGDSKAEIVSRVLLYDLAAAVGIGLAAYEAASSYAKERKAFGKAIYEYEEIRRFLNESYSKLKASEDLLISEDVDPKMAIWQVVEAVTFATEKASQIFGGYGFINEYPVSKYMRDARMLRSLVIKRAYV